MKFLNRSILLSIIASYLFFSCSKKYPKDYINGTVTEYGSNTPIAHATVILESSDGKSTKFDSIYTDNTGKYDFNKSLTKGLNYHLYIRDNNHFSNSSVIDENNKPPYDKALYSIAYLKFRIKKNASDSNGIFIDIPRLNGGGWEYFSLIKYQAFDTILHYIIKETAENPININWQIFHFPYYNSQISGSNSVISINKGDTLTYLIQYD